LRKNLAGAFRAPIAVQIVALMVAGLVAGQLVNLLIILLMPAQHPPMYRMDEIAAALQGTSLQPRFGRPLTRETATEPPADERPGRPADHARRELASVMNLPVASVRLSMVGPPAWAMVVHGMAPQPEEAHGYAHHAMMMGAPGMGPGMAPPGMAPPGMAPPGMAPDSEPPPGAPDASPGGGRPWMGLGQRPIFGAFVAAVQQPSGGWVVVRPQPEPFFNAWHSRLILWFLGCIAVMAPAGYLFARRVTAPIADFAQAADRLGRDPKAPLIELRGPAELGAAVRAFNDMQVRLKRYVEDRTAMVGAISHDLRTPLTRIRFKMEGAGDALRASVIGDVEQMEAMITAVLTFIRDANEPHARERLDLLSLLECAVDDAALVGLDASLAEGQPLIVNADALGLRRLFDNLIDNAVKYGGSARVSLEQEGGEAVVRVADQGPGLSAGDLEKVFEPFYRTEPSRNRDSGGIGLGLSVARSVARAHGGDVVLEPGQPGLMAVVRLPLAQAAGAA
jgi:two-component system OmpR family sensor kinase